MSADNGIYILKSPECDNGFFTGKDEYRVAYASAIDNLSLGQSFFKPVETPTKAYGKLDLGLLYEILIFGKSEVFKDKIQALVKADELSSQHPYTEYGIVTIHRNHPFSDNISNDEANELIKEYFSSY